MDPLQTQQPQALDPQSQNTAQPSPQMNEDEIAAALGFITTLHQQYMPDPTQEGDQAAPQGAQDPNTQPAPTKNTPQPAEELNKAKDEIIGEIHQVKDEMVSEHMKQEFADIKTKLDELLKEDQQDANTG